MQLSSKHLIGLPVQTQSGHILGKVADSFFDSDTGRLEKLHVRPIGLLKGLIDQELIITWSQIIAISETGIVVRDASIPTTARPAFSQT